MASGRGISVKVLAVVATFGLAAGMAMGAQAADRQYCRHLETELNSAPLTRSASTMLSRYERAIDEQTAELSRAHSMARSSGCAAAFGNPRVDASSRCDPIARTIDRMERNMSMLEGRRDALSERGDAPSRQEILAALDANGCRDSETSDRRLPGPVGEDDEGSGRVLFSRVNPGVIIHRSGPAQDGDIPGATSNTDPSASYRTMCVRTCDGFYFPISFATSPANFARDEQTCQAQCPGAAVELYYHVPDQESEDMVSLAGAPYKDLPTAFLYRKANAPRVPGCTCALAGRSSIMATTPSELTAPDPSGQSRPDAGAAPWTAEASNDAAAHAPTPETDKNRKVRVVGPTFLPDPSKAIDLQAPARKKAP